MIRVIMLVPVLLVLSYLISLARRKLQPVAGTTGGEATGKITILGLRWGFWP